MAAHSAYLNPMATMAAVQMQQMATINPSGLITTPITPSSGKPGRRWDGFCGSRQPHRERHRHHPCCCLVSPAAASWSPLAIRRCRTGEQGSFHGLRPLVLTGVNSGAKTLEGQNLPAAAILPAIPSSALFSRQVPARHLPLLPRPCLPSRPPSASTATALSPPRAQGSRPPRPSTRTASTPTQVPLLPKAPFSRRPSSFFSPCPIPCCCCLAFVPVPSDLFDTLHP